MNSAAQGARTQAFDVRSIMAAEGPPNGFARAVMIRRRKVKERRDKLRLLRYSPHAAQLINLSSCLTCSDSRCWLMRFHPTAFMAPAASPDVAPPQEPLPL